MAQKTYRAKTVISTNVMVGTACMHIRFIPFSYGGSVYTTDNTVIQEALEGSNKFGKLYELISTGAESTKPLAESTKPLAQSTKPLAQSTKSGAQSTQEGAESEKQETGSTVKVSDLEEARDYLEEHFGVMRSAMRRKSAVEEIAAQNGIKFEGL